MHIFDLKNKGALKIWGRKIKIKKMGMGKNIKFYFLGNQINP